jgi:CheY-like chemotaxis protein
MKQPKILVVDDDADLRDSLKVLFENAGYVMVSASNRTDGMERICAERPDLIVLDVVMETWQDGFEMSRELKNSPQFRDTPILMLTCIAGLTGIDVKSSAGDPVWLPVDGFLDKPTPPETLLAEVRRLLQSAASSRPISGVAARRGSGGFCSLEWPQVITGE